MSGVDMSGELNNTGGEAVTLLSKKKEAVQAKLSERDEMRRKDKEEEKKKREEREDAAEDQGFIHQKLKEELKKLEVSCRSSRWLF